MENVKLAGGKTYVFSSLHPSGEQLNNVSVEGKCNVQLTGIAAILRFPMEEMFDSESSEGEEQEDFQICLFNKL